MDVLTRFSTDFYIPDANRHGGPLRPVPEVGTESVGADGLPRKRERMGASIHDVVDQICRRHPRYADRAYIFVLEALHERIVQLETPRHISGRELASAARDLALERFGPLARIVLEHWGVHGTSDIGEIVFLLIDHGILTKQESDRREDFEGLFSFERVFESEYPWGGVGASRRTG